MSKIINVGIQQNGIVNTAPTAIRASELDRVLLFVNDGDKATIASDYLLLDSQKLSPADYNNYLKSYPALASEPVYKLNTSDKTEISKLSSIFVDPILIVSYIESGAASSMLGNLPAGTDPFTVLSRLPPAQMDAIHQTAARQLAALPDSMKTQSDISYLSAEYRTVGVNISQMQLGYMVNVGGLMLLLTLPYTGKHLLLHSRRLPRGTGSSRIRA